MAFDSPGDDFSKPRAEWGEQPTEPRPEEKARNGGKGKHETLHLAFGFDATRPKPMGTIVEGLLHAGSLSLIYGPPKSGKSFLATDLGLSIAAGDADWMGHEIVRPGPVLYVACEGHGGFWKRLTAATKTRRWICWNERSPRGGDIATGSSMTRTMTACAMIPGSSG